MRLIDADALIAYCDKNWIPLNVDAVNAQPTIKPEWKTGKWIERDSNGVWQCDQCRKYCLIYKAHYCPNCGADMRGN